MITLLKNYIYPAAMSLLPEKMNSPEAKAILTAICLQESALRYRRQIGGPALGLWQWELPQVGLVLRHAVVGPLARNVLAALVYDPGDPPHQHIHAAMEHNDVLQCAFSRLLLWPDAAPLPKRDDVQGSLATYLRVWKPGRPHPQKWPANWAAAWLAVGDRNA
jgi:hypothetical protein